MDEVISQHITSIVQLAGKTIFDEGSVNADIGEWEPRVMTYVHDGKDM